MMRKWILCPMLLLVAIFAGCGGSGTEVSGPAYPNTASEAKAAYYDSGSMLDLIYVMSEPFDVPPEIEIDSFGGWLSVSYLGREILYQPEGFYSDVLYGKTMNGHDVILVERWIDAYNRRACLFIDGELYWDFDSPDPYNRVFDVSDFDGRHLVARLEYGSLISGYYDYWALIDIGLERYLDLGIAE